MAESQKCIWKADSLDGQVFETGCGETFYLTDGTPSENKMKYCPFCGLVIEDKNG